MQLDFTITAMRRPGILRDTLESFAQNLHGVDLCASTLFINIDPLPEEGDLDGVLAVADSFFGHVVANLTTEPSFPAAVKWCWSKPQGEIHFHSEDDWQMTDAVDIGGMIRALDADPALSVVNLRAYHHNDDRICLAPGLWRTAHARAIGTALELDANPELQLRRQSPQNPKGGKHEGYKGMQYPAQIVIHDIGRAWLAQMPYKRDGNRKFVRWQRTAVTVAAT